MQQNIYVLYDAKAGAYLTPFFFQNDSLAVRQMMMLLENKEGVFALHPEDFTLFQIGAYHDDTGTIDPCEPLALCGLGALSAQMTVIGQSEQREEALN